jgi:YVTN family beta-propeller protein
MHPQETAMGLKTMARPAPLAFVASCLTALAWSHAVAAGAAAGVAYVSNQNGDISVIDLATLSATSSVSAYGKEPRGIGITADGKLLVVANREGGRIAVIDRASGQLLRHVAVGDNPEFVRVRGHLAFVTCEPSSDAGPPGAPASGPKADGPAASGAAKDDDSHEPAHIAVVDLDTGRLVRSITGGLETEGIEFSADGRRLLVTNEADDNVSVHDIATGKLLRKIDLKAWGTRPRGIKMSPDGKRYVVTLEFSNAFVVIDENYRVVQSVKTGEAPYGVAFDRAGKRLFVAAARSKTLQVFDADTFAPIKDVATGARCWHFSFTPDDSNILVACGRSNEIVVIDARTLEPVKRIADGQLPWGIVTYPKAPGSVDRVE